MKTKESLFEASKKYYQDTYKNLGCVDPTVIGAFEAGAKWMFDQCNTPTSKAPIYINNDVMYIKNEDII